MLKINLFGSGQAKYYDRYISGFPNQRPSLLLCYLLLNRAHPHHRERLAAAFWGESPGQSARKQLRNALWSLRQVIQSAGAPPNDYLCSDDESIAFINTSRYWLDVERFEAPILQWREIDSFELTPDQARQIESAAGLYTGDLLENVYEDWCVPDRERLRQLYLEALNKLLVYHAAINDFGRSLEFSQRILVADHTNEAAHRQVMCLYWLVGNSGSALAEYKRFSQMLRDELHGAPDAETRGLYEQIRHGKLQSKAVILRRYFQPPRLVDSLPSEPASVEQLLHRLHRLQDTMEETRAELWKIERQLHQTLGALPSS